MPGHKKIDVDKEKLEKALNGYVQSCNISQLNVDVIKGGVTPDCLIAKMDINNQHLECEMSQYKQQYGIFFKINDKYFNTVMLGENNYTIDDGISMLTNMIRKIHNNDDSFQGMFSLETPTKGGIFYH